ncbi:MAG: hypothetical protein HKN33_09160 [Pyrinomonadaceae bacterium]|nr:hypothetical protein [Pyrinomonadaceae bacterium]
MKASQFEDAKIGYAGVLSEYARSLEILLNEDGAVLKSLLENGTLTGKLYALCGLFYTDKAFFDSKLPDFRDSSKIVGMTSGCEIYDESVPAIVESSAKNVAVIAPHETLEKYLAGNAGQSYNVDIANGGYPATFRHFAKQELENTK